MSCNPKIGQFCGKTMNVFLNALAVLTNLDRSTLLALNVHKVHQWKFSSSQRDVNRAKPGDRRTEQTQFVYQTDGQIAMAIDMVIGQLEKEMSTNVCTHYIKSSNRQKGKLDCSYGNGAHAFRQTE